MKEEAVKRFKEFYPKVESTEVTAFELGYGTGMNDKKAILRRFIKWQRRNDMLQGFYPKMLEAFLREENAL